MKSERSLCALSLLFIMLDATKQCMFLAPRRYVFSLFSLSFLMSFCLCFCSDSSMQSVLCIHMYAIGKPHSPPINTLYLSLSRRHGFREPGPY
ncbi:uncharacterized protein BDW43DRAFT_86126 [Aspergillus alliaceus]|uniref:uncharacterized protein n=1 Tax=Petromyces alliaceus TaxID=209559 RepID=UPI0012A5337C|nr:uncharacterized protein BDW43DRAFT_86126 [Aspergillus alliaceus]KAB8233384.1 hypothetical protein BDW43DRAFT_86126 [Aspergillus alliaceus]